MQQRQYGNDLQMACWSSDPADILVQLGHTVPLVRTHLGSAFFAVSSISSCLSRCCQQSLKTGKGLLHSMLQVARVLVQMRQQQSCHQIPCKWQNHLKPLSAPSSEPPQHAYSDGGDVEGKYTLATSLKLTSMHIIMLMIAPGYVLEAHQHAC